jgi:glutamine synthetase
MDDSIVIKGGASMVTKQKSLQNIKNYNQNKPPITDWESFLVAVEKGEVDTVILAGVDMQGRLYGKKVPVGHFIESLKDGIHTCALNFAWDISLTLGEFDYCNVNTGFHDIKTTPDLNTLRLYPWVEKTALVMCDAYDDEGNPVEVAPRTILKKQIGKAQKMGYSVQAASELEFHLYKETPESIREKNFHEPKPLFPYPVDYSIYRLNVDDWFLKQLTRNLDLANVPVDSLKGEWGLGQVELNIKHSEILEMADRTAIYKGGIKEMAILNNIMATFMAKVSSNSAGSGGHTHISLWDLNGDKNLFWDQDGEFQLSKIGRHFLGGMLALSRDFMLFYAPYINSYKRLADTTAGAPDTVSWGIDNRAASSRTVGRKNASRIENRISGADINYHLVLSACLAAGLYGIENEIEPPAPVKGDLSSLDLPKLPSNLLEAIEAFDKSLVVRSILGDEVVEHYLTAARLEVKQYFTEVTDWERRKYFEFI